MYFCCQVALKDTELPVVTRLQNRVKDLEREKQRLRKQLDRYSPEHGVGESDAEREIHDTIKVRVAVLMCSHGNTLPCW